MPRPAASSHLFWGVAHNERRAAPMAGHGVEWRAMEVAKVGKEDDGISMAR